MAMKPLAPGFASTMTCRPQIVESFSASTRMKMVGPEPLEYGAVILTVLLGYGCAIASPAASQPAASLSAIENCRFIVVASAEWGYRNARLPAPLRESTMAT